MENLNTTVFVKGEGRAMWDSINYNLERGATVKLGVARFWESRGLKISIEFDETPEIPPRDIVNPLADETQGEAFQGLKRGRRPKEG